MSGVEEKKGFHERILDSIWTGVWAVDKNENITFFNKGMEYIFGVSKEQVIGKNLIQYVNDQSMRDQGDFKELFCRVKRTLRPAPYDSLSMVTTKGELVYQSGVLIPLVAEGGNYDGMIGTVEDVTQKMLNEKAILDALETEKELEAIYKSSPVVAFLRSTGDDWPVEYISENISQFGYEPGDFKTGCIKYFDIVCPDDMEMFRAEALRHELDGSEYFSLDYRILTSDGDVRWVSERSLIGRIEDAFATCYQGIFIDITERKIAQEARLEAEKRYRLIFENSPLGVFDFDKEGVVRHCNNNLINILGLPKEDIIGFNLMTSLRDERMKEAFDSVLSRKSGYYEGEYKSTTGKKITPIRAYYSPNLAEDGSLLGGIGIIEDVTERKRAYDALKVYAAELSKVNEELKSLDKMKDEFLSNVSHELNTPLVSIKGYNELIYDGTLGEINPEQKNALEIVSRNTRRLMGLVNSLLYISMARAGTVEYKFTPVRILDIIENAIQDIQLQAEDKDLLIKRQVPEDLPLVNGDKEKLTDMLTNILDNSVKFTAKGGEVSIGVEEENEYLHIKISDNGIGIPGELIPKLFQRFYQLDASTRRKYGGTGLGLYICKNIVDVHNGEIWVESDEGVGTTVHIRLPK